MVVKRVGAGVGVGRVAGSAPRRAERWCEARAAFICYATSQRRHAVCAGRGAAARVSARGVCVRLHRCLCLSASAASVYWESLGCPPAVGLVCQQAWAYDSATEWLL